jgi:hypothetical protein
MTIDASATDPSPLNIYGKYSIQVVPLSRTPSAPATKALIMQLAAAVLGYKTISNSIRLSFQ